MKSFEWVNAGSVKDAAKLLDPVALKLDAKTDPDDLPRPYAGGQDLLTTMKSYITRPPRVVNLKTIQGLAGIEGDAAKGLTIGALTTLSEIEEHPVVRKNFPGLAEAAASVGSPQIRNLGTIGGNLCQRPRCWYFRLENYKCLKKGGSECFAANGENKYNAILGGGPSYFVHPSDLAPMLVALGASVTIAGPGNARQMPLEQFFILPTADLRHENVLKPGEIITQIQVPSSPMSAKSTYLKFKERQSLDFAMSAVAAAVELGVGGIVKQARLVLGGVAPIPWRATKAEAAIIGKALDEATINQAAILAVDGASPLDNNAYKIPLTQALVRRALAKLK